LSDDRHQGDRHFGPMEGEGPGSSKGRRSRALGERNETLQRRFAISAKNIHRKAMGFTVLVLFGSMSGYAIFTPSPNDSDVGATGIGKGMKIGTTFTQSESLQWQPRNFEIPMRKGVSSSRMLFWANGMMSGSIVTVKVNGQAIAENLNLFATKPKVLEVPVPGVVEVVGVKDGGRGITYAVKLPGAAEDNVYFNTTSEGSSNSYTLIAP